MTLIEIFALIFAVALLLKLVFVLFSPKTWGSFADKVWQSKQVAGFIFLILVLVTGWYLFQAYTIVDVAAVMLFTSLLMAFTMAPFADKILRLKDEVASMPELKAKAWLPMVVWAIIGVWTLWQLFA